MHGCKLFKGVIMNNSSAAVQAKSALTWWVYLLVTVWLAVSLAWSVYARFDYGYGYWYEKQAIAVHIATYAPAHPYKRGFAQLSQEQHIAAFRQIVESVHDHGEGLAQIQYQVTGQAPVALLDQAEVEHLQDVSNLLDWARSAFYLLFPVWLCLAFMLRNGVLPSWRLRMAAMLGSLLPVAAALVVMGPKALFYRMHELIFPANHQWFFYWEESLMSTLMKAPYLFGDIAMVLACVAAAFALLLYFFGLYAGRYFVRR
jgi:uncharacterized protein DUF1461